MQADVKGNGTHDCSAPSGAWKGSGSSESD